MIIAPIDMAKSRILIVGTGGIGTVSAYSLEKGGQAEVTAVMRSNYEAAMKDGIDIDSVQYGQVKGWKPTASEMTPVGFLNNKTFN